MELSDQLRCLFSATVEQRDDSYVITVPDREVQLGEIDPSETYRVVVLPSLSDDSSDSTETPPQHEQGPPEPPVEKGEQRIVEIENLGDQGDGITRVERGFVVIVPDTDPGERVTVEITDVRETVAFADVVERLSYYD